MIYVPGYTPDKVQKPCVYSFSHEKGLKVISVCNTKEEAQLKVVKFNDFLKKYKKKK